MEKDLIQVVNNKTMTTSLLMAEKFKKNHSHILRDIDDLINRLKDNPFLDSPQLFEKTTYLTSQNKIAPMYLINRDGFTLLAMGFSNTPIVLEWKLKYIQAFNEMEKKIKSSPTTLPDNRLEIVKLMSKAKDFRVSDVKALFPEYFGNTTDPGILECTVERNTSYTKWIEEYGINAEWIGDFPTSDIYNNYARFCIENRFNNIMGKKTFYKILSDDFRLVKKQKPNGFRYFVTA